MGKRIFLLKLIIGILFLTNELQAFTLMMANPPRYGVEEVFIDFTSDTCTNTGHSASDLHLMAEEAVNEYWNKASTSRLILKKGNVTTVSSDGLSLDSLASQAGQNKILIGCNDDVGSFAGGSVGAVGGIKSSSGQVMGAVLLNDHISSAVPNLSRSELVALMAHELGHALGIGHSTEEMAVMYYSIGGKIQEQMTQDDFDALSYLYPNEKKLLGLVGSCGTVAMVDQKNDDDDEDGNGPGAVHSMGLNIILGLFLISLLSYSAKRWRFFFSNLS